MPKSAQELDSNNVVVPLMELTKPQNNITNAASAVFASLFVRIQAITDSYILFSSTGTVCTSATGHFLASGGCYDLPVGQGKNQVYILGTCNVSELI